MSSTPARFHPTQGTPSGETETELRVRAHARLKAKRDLQIHLFIYVAVNSLLVVIWWFLGAGYFWPVFPILGWGIGLAFNVWVVVSPTPSRDAVQAEMDRLRGQQH
jgi:hypothetical protein